MISVSLLGFSAETSFSGSASDLRACLYTRFKGWQGSPMSGHRVRDSSYGNVQNAKLRGNGKDTSGVQVPGRGLHRACSWSPLEGRRMC